MKKVEKARDLLAGQEMAVVVFTHGLHFCLHSNGTGDIGNWAINPEMVECVDKVIVYLRDDQRRINKVFIGNYAGLKASPDKGRYLICFSRLREIGLTDRNWFDFADGNLNPISFMEG